MFLRIRPITGSLAVPFRLRSEVVYIPPSVVPRRALPAIAADEREGVSLEERDEEFRNYYSTDAGAAYEARTT